MGNDVVVEYFRTKGDNCLLLPTAPRDAGPRQYVLSHYTLYATVDEEAGERCWKDKYNNSWFYKTLGGDGIAGEGVVNG